MTGIVGGVIAAPLSSRYEANVTVSDGANSFIRTIVWRIASAQNIVELANPLGSGLLTITSPVGTQLTASISSTAGLNLPGGVMFPIGFLTISIDGLVPGDGADLTLEGFDVGAITDYYKYGPTPADASKHWYNFLFGQQTDGDSAVGTGMEIFDGKTVLYLVDGGRGDDDLLANGIISDIGGPAIVDATMNQPPLLTPIGEKTVDEHQTLQFTVIATDSDLPANVLTLSVGTLPTGASFEASTGVFNWTPSETQQGIHELSFVVTDDGTPSLSDYETITITVNEVNAVADSCTGRQQDGQRTRIAQLYHHRFGQQRSSSQ